MHWCRINWVQHEMLMQSQNVDAISEMLMQSLCTTCFILWSKQDVGDTHVQIKLSNKCETINDVSKMINVK